MKHTTDLAMLAKSIPQKHATAGCNRHRSGDGCTSFSAMHVSQLSSEKKFTTVLPLFRLEGIVHACLSINISHFLLGLSDLAAMQRVSLQLCTELLGGSILHVLCCPFSPRHVS
jgi:hypothetical protein